MTDAKPTTNTKDDLANLRGLVELAQDIYDSFYKTQYCDPELLQAFCDDIPDALFNIKYDGLSLNAVNSMNVLLYEIASGNLDEIIELSKMSTASTDYVKKALVFFEQFVENGIIAVSDEVEPGEPDLATTVDFLKKTYSGAIVSFEDISNDAKDDGFSPSILKQEILSLADELNECLDSYGIAVLKFGKPVHDLFTMVELNLRTIANEMDFNKDDIRAALDKISPSFDMLDKEIKNLDNMYDKQ